MSILNIEQAEKSAALVDLIIDFGTLRYRSGCSTDQSSEKLMRESEEVLNKVWRTIDELTSKHASMVSAEPVVIAGEMSGAIRFAGMVLETHRNNGEPGDLDGDFLQNAAEKCGLIERMEVSAPCCEGCTCAGIADFPTECLFNTDAGKDAIAASKLPTLPD